jgi:hypothetical protein
MRRRTQVLAPEDFELTEVHLSQPAAGQVLALVLMPH